MIIITTQDLADFLDGPVPDGAARALEEASEMVEAIVIGIHASTPSTAETDAIKKAVCIQAEKILESGKSSGSQEGPFKEITSVRIGNFTMSGNSGAISGATLDARARRVLLNAGLLYRGVSLR